LHTNFDVDENAEFEILDYAVTNHKGSEAAQKAFHKYARMEERRLRPSEPVTRAYDDRHDPKDRGMSFSLELAMGLAGKAAKLYVADGKVMSTKGHQAPLKTAKTVVDPYMTRCYDFLKSC
jgi:hypothetical protein